MNSLKPGILSRTIIVVAAVLAACPATAQDFQLSPVFDVGVLANTLTIPADGGAGKSAGAKARRPVPGGDTRLSYTVTPELRRAALDRYIARVRQKSPESAQTLAAQFAKNDYAKVYRDMMAGSTLRDNDAVDAVTAYTLLGWQVANEHRDGIPDRQFEAVRRQLAPQLAANPRLADPRNRAGLGEEMKLLCITVFAGWQGAAKEGNSKRYSDGIAAMFKQQSGRDLRALRLTDTGFAPR